MTYFGLDLLPCKINGKTEILLGEIGGMDTGRSGFNTIYGDNRVTDEVRNMIFARYGDVLLNAGLFNEVYQRTGLSKYEEVFEYLKKNDPRPLKKEISYAENKNNPFGKEVYLGQEGRIVANVINPPAGPTLVNPSNATLATIHKVFQIHLFEWFKNDIPHIPGEVYGAIDSNLDVVLGKTGKIIIKKDTGSCGNDIEIITDKELIKRSKTWTQKGDQICFDENYSMKDDVYIMQPLYDTSNSRNDFTSIRSVVCNEEFVDAYARVSKDPIVNISRDARAKSITLNQKNIYGKISEDIVKEFLRISLEMESFMDAFKEK